jgi:protein SCO1
MKKEELLELRTDLYQTQRALRLSSQTLLMMWRSVSNVSLYLFLLVSFHCSSVSFLHADTNIRDFGPAPEFSGIDHKGNKFSASASLPGRISVVNFFFTHCDGPCPALMLRIRKIVDSVNCPDAQFISISVDPERDTLDVLSEYIRSRGIAHESWTLLSMEEEPLVSLLNQGFKLGSGGDMINHSTRIVIIDREQRIRSILPGMDADTNQRVIDSITTLCR